MSPPSLVKLGPRTPENRLPDVPHPLKLHGENVISLKFCTEFKHVTPEVLQKFKAKRSNSGTDKLSKVRLCENYPRAERNT